MSNDRLIEMLKLSVSASEQAMTQAIDRDTMLFTSGQYSSVAFLFLRAQGVEAETANNVIQSRIQLLTANKFHNSIKN
jgi:hypothetical protein